MVAVAVLALAVVPMLVTREFCWTSAYDSKVSFRMQELAKEKLADIALNVTRDEGSGSFENDPAFSFEYEVTLYDFASGLEDEDLNKQDDGVFDTSRYSDAVYDRDDPDNVGPLMARHVILKIYGPSADSESQEPKEFVLETYLPVLMTRKQWDRMRQEEGR